MPLTVRMLMSVSTMSRGKVAVELGNPAEWRVAHAVSFTTTAI
jgi:hypothetical protein